MNPVVTSSNSLFGMFMVCIAMNAKINEINWPKEVKPHLYFPMDLIQNQSYLFYCNVLLDKNLSAKFSEKKQQYLFSTCARFHFC